MAESRASRRSATVFSLSFLDAMTCGFGAVVLLYMVINATVAQRTDTMTAQLKAESERLDIEVLEGQRRLVELRNSLRDVERQNVIAQGLSSRLIENLEELEVELATYENTTLAQKEHVNKLMADLKSLEESTRRLSASIPREEPAGDRLRSFIGDGERQYLTGLKVGGKRILILVDTSASMLGGTIVDVIRRRNLPTERKRLSDKWQHALASVDWVTTQIPRDSQFQIYAFNEAAWAVTPDSDGRWLDGGDLEALNQAVSSTRELVPEKGTNLYRAFEAIGKLQPAPDNVILLADGLPTLGRAPAKGPTITEKRRLRLFNEAFDLVPRGIPVNVLLFPMEGDPRAASSYWQLAMATEGSLLSLSEDWP
jgi:hypothetical protein